MSAATLLVTLIALLKAQTDLITAITATQPDNVRAELWNRFADDTRWIHDALAKLNAHLESIIGVAPATVPEPPK